MNISLSELAARMGGTLVGSDAQVHGFALDSKDAAEGLVFLAIKGSRVDGHSYVGNAQNSGITACVVERAIEGTHILVKDVVKSIGFLGQSYREEFSGPVIGVTGSNGKTTTKQLIAAALSPLGPVLMNLGNQNSEYTSPLTWTRLEPEHKTAVIEMGMRGFGQISYLAGISKPTIGLITMIGSAHIEMVGSRAGIAKAKGELFESLPASGTAIAWAEDDFIQDLKAIAPENFLTFGFSPDADLKVIGYRVVGMNQSEVLLEWKGERCSVDLRTIGRHNALNAAAAVLVATQCGVDFAKACASIATAELPPMRMETIEMNGAQVLLDNYNASPDSMIAALKTLGELPCTGRRLAVVGAMKELGSALESGHRAVGHQLTESNLDFCILIGDETRFTREQALQDGFPSENLLTVENLEGVRSFLSEVVAGDLVLIKGSRALGLEDALPLGVRP